MKSDATNGPASNLGDKAEVGVQPAKLKDVESGGHKYSLSQENLAKVKFITAVALMSMIPVFGAGVAFVARNWLAKQHDAGWPQTAHKTRDMEMATRSPPAAPMAMAVQRTEVGSQTYKTGTLFYNATLEIPQGPASLINKTISYVERAGTRFEEPHELEVVGFRDGTFEVRSTNPNDSTTHVSLYLLMNLRSEVKVKSYKDVPVDNIA